MKAELIASTLLSLSIVSARPVILAKREVPQEHSHQKYLDLVDQGVNIDNPDKIQSSVFGLLGDAAAAAGKGNIANVKCLQQATADRAFTNFKKAGNVAGMAGALIYRGLEKNTGKVGLASDDCPETAVNPEIAAIKQHQDPASDGAAAKNKAITLEIAKQIKAVGGNPAQALDAGTFKPGDKADSTGKGNTCDDQNDKEGCIFTQKLIVPDATPEEITAAAGGGKVKRAGEFGSCTDPTIKFGPGFDGRKENSFEPNNQKEFSHGSALNAKVITGFICDNLTNSCKAGQDAVDKCKKAADAANSQTGQQAADTFNSLLTGKAAAASTNTAAAAPAAASAAPAKNSQSAANSGAASGAAGGAAGGAQNFGSCTDPTIKFGPGFDGRKENSFEPSNTKDFSHGSALNAKVITGFICDNLTNKCKAGQDAVDNCKKAADAANSQTGQQAADTFNGIITGKQAAAAA